MIDGWGVLCQIALIWMSVDRTDDKSTLVQVMAWCRQATSHYPRQCWPSSLPSYGVTRPQWVESVISSYLTLPYLILGCTRGLRSSPGGPYLHRHRSPPLHHPRRRQHSRYPQRQRHGTRHTCWTCRTERILFPITASTDEKTIGNIR